MDIMNRIQALLRQSGRPQNELAEFLGVRKQVFSDWKAGRNASYQKRLPEIAEFFGISVDELIGKEETPPDPWSQTDDEVRARFMRVFDETDEEGRQLLLQMLEAAQRAYNENKGKK